MNWDLSNSTPYAATTMLACDRDGRDIWLTVVKATFDIAPDGSLACAEAQLPLVFTPLYAGDPSRASLLAESDIDYVKAGVDVLVQGSAQAPEGRVVREMVVSLEVGGRRKSLRVCGPRQWTRQGLNVVPSEPQPFARLPVVYEHAFGGFDPVEENEQDERNPAGCGYARDPSRLLDRPAPQIVYHGEARDASTPRPAGFGPIARHWLPRRGFAGTYDDAWQAERLPLLPTDFDERFFLAAPEDQQFPALPPHAPVSLTGMSPYGSLSFELPRLALGINVRFNDQEEYRRPVLRTVLVLPDACKVVMTYADALPCTGRKFRIMGTELIEKKFIQ